MKKIFGMIILMLVLLPTQAQIPTTQGVGDSLTYFTAEQQAIYSDLNEKKLETYGNWVGVGGEDILKIVFGIIILIIFTSVIMYSFKHTCFEHKIIKKEINKRTFLLYHYGFLKYPKHKKYKIIKSKYNNEDIILMRFGHLVIFLFGFILILIAIFN